MSLIARGFTAFKIARLTGLSIKYIYRIFKDYERAERGERRKKSTN